jgi:hypothetical protein
LLSFILWTPAWAEPIRAAAVRRADFMVSKEPPGLLKTGFGEGARDTKLCRRRRRALEMEMSDEDGWGWEDVGGERARREREQDVAAQVMIQLLRQKRSWEDQ